MIKLKLIIVNFILSDIMCEINKEYEKIDYTNNYETPYYTNFLPIK